MNLKNGTGSKNLGEGLPQVKKQEIFLNNSTKAITFFQFYTWARLTDNQLFQLDYILVKQLYRNISCHTYPECW